MIEEQEQRTVSVQHYAHNAPRIIHPKIAHQDTCESDAGLVEDIGICSFYKLFVQQQG